MNIPKNHEQVLEFAETGTIVNGVLKMPTLYSINTHGKYLLWTIYVGICDTEPINVTQEYIDRGELPDNASGYYYTISGIEGMKMSRSENTYIHQGKNAGKKNYTTAFTQALLDARSLFNKKVKKGSKLDKETIKGPGAAYTFEELVADESRGDASWRVFAMSLHDYNKQKQKINYPATVQYKLDGTLFIVVHHPLLPEMKVLVGRELDYSSGGDGPMLNIYEKMRIDGYSRSRETYEGQDHILREIYSIALKYPGLHFVGELWKRGYGLQEISGMSRRKADTKLTDHVEMDFNIFDCFYIDQPEMGFEERQAILDDVFTDLSVIHDGYSEDTKNIKDNERSQTIIRRYKKPIHITRIPTLNVNTEEEMMNIYKGYLDEGYEGAVIRDLTAPYEFGINKEIRSYKTLKLKPRPDAEWPIVGFTDGKGKEVGLVIWTCAENDKGVQERTGELLPLEERKTFNVTPNQPTELRRQIFEKLSNDPKFFKEKIYGQDAVISYSVLSKDGLGQQPKMLRFRDPSINELLLTI